MLIVIQFPIADGRCFVSGKRRLESPRWPTPVTQIKPEFVHFFGRTVERRLGADNAWTDEMAFCLARRAIQLPSLERQRIGPPAQRLRPMSAFRRLFSDGGAVARLEVGIAHNVRLGKLTNVTAASLIQSVTDFCGLDTSVGAAGGRNRKPILRQGDAIARLYERATSRILPAAPAGATPESLIRAGQPMLLVETGQRTPTIELPGFRTIDSSKSRGAHLSFGRVKTKAGLVDTWLLQRGTAKEPDLRSLRVCLLRLHAEQECLDQILHLVASGTIPDDQSGDAIGKVEDYLNRSTRLIKRDEWAGVSQSAILEAYDAGDAVIAGAEKTQLMSRVEGGRRQVWRKAEDYRARRAATRVVSVTNEYQGDVYVEKSFVTNTNVTGSGNTVNVMVAEYMNNVTANVNAALQKSNAPDAVQDLIKTLTAQIKDVSEKVDAQKVRDMGSDVETLAKEVSSPSPRRKWYEVSLEGLKEAAEAVGELGAPIAATIKKLWPLLLA